MLSFLFYFVVFCLSLPASVKYGLTLLKSAHYHSSFARKDNGVEPTNQIFGPFFCNFFALFFQIALTSNSRAVFALKRLTDN